MSKEMVIHPEHYNQEGKKECWDEMVDLFGAQAVAIFDALNAYKYRYRAGLKEGNSTEQDTAKIDNYMRHCADLLATHRESPYAPNNDGLDLAVRCYVKMRDLV